MIVSIVDAKSKNNVIGKNNALPWHLPADLKHFKAVTMGKPILMGRKTFESIGRLLPGRRNIIISRDKNYVAAGCDVFSSIDDALHALAHEAEIMIIGGATIYEQILSRTNRIYLTEVDVQIAGDAFFPDINWQHWRLVSDERHVSDDKNPHAYCFQLWEK